MRQIATAGFYIKHAQMGINAGRCRHVFGLGFFKILFQRADLLMYEEKRSHYANGVNERRALDNMASDPGAASGGRGGART